MTSNLCNGNSNPGTTDLEAEAVQLPEDQFSDFLRDVAKPSYKAKDIGVEVKPKVEKVVVAKPVSSNAPKKKSVFVTHLADALRKGADQDRDDMDQAVDSSFNRTLSKSASHDSYNRPQSVPPEPMSILGVGGGGGGGVAARLTSSPQLSSLGDAVDQGLVFPQLVQHQSNVEVYISKNEDVARLEEDLRQGKHTGRSSSTVMLPGTFDPAPYAGGRCHSPTTSVVSAPAPLGGGQVRLDLGECTHISPPIPYIDEGLSSADPSPTHAPVSVQSQTAPFSEEQQWYSTSLESGLPPINKHDPSIISYTPQNFNGQSYNNSRIRYVQPANMETEMVPLKGSHQGSPDSDYGTTDNKRNRKQKNNHKKQTYTLPNDSLARNHYDYTPPFTGATDFQMQLQQPYVIPSSPEEHQRTKHKKKVTDKSVKNSIIASPENIEGFCGQKDLDKLVEYVEGKKQHQAAKRDKKVNNLLKKSVSAGGSRVDDKEMPKSVSNSEFGSEHVDEESINTSYSIKDDAESECSSKSKSLSEPSRTSTPTVDEESVVANEDGPVLDLTDLRLYAPDDQTLPKTPTTEEEFIPVLKHKKKTKTRSECDHRERRGPGNHRSVTPPPSSRRDRSSLPPTHPNRIGRHGMRHRRSSASDLTHISESVDDNKPVELAVQLWPTVSETNTPSLTSPLTVHVQQKQDHNSTQVLNSGASSAPLNPAGISWARIVQKIPVSPSPIPALSASGQRPQNYGRKTTSLQTSRASSPGAPHSQSQRNERNSAATTNQANASTPDLNLFPSVNDNSCMNEIDRRTSESGLPSLSSPSAINTQPVQEEELVTDEVSKVALARTWASVVQPSRPTAIVKPFGPHAPHICTNTQPSNTPIKLVQPQLETDCTVEFGTVDVAESQISFCAPDQPLSHAASLTVQTSSPFATVSVPKESNTSEMGGVEFPFQLPAQTCGISFGDTDDVPQYSNTPSPQPPTSSVLSAQPPTASVSSAQPPNHSVSSGQTPTPPLSSTLPPTPSSNISTTHMTMIKKLWKDWVRHSASGAVRYSDLGCMAAADVAAAQSLRVLAPGNTSST